VDNFRNKFCSFNTKFLKIHLKGGKRKKLNKKTESGKEPPGSWLGTHLLLELKDCGPKTLTNLEFVSETLKNAAIEAKATVVEVAFHEFSPFGISGMVVIAESHLAIHTWPEYDYAAVDVFTCGTLIDPMVAAEYLIEKFQSKNPQIFEMKRGVLGLEKMPHKIEVEIKSSAKSGHAPEEKSEEDEQFPLVLLGAACM